MDFFVASVGLTLDVSFQVVQEAEDSIQNECYYGDQNQDVLLDFC